MKLSNKRIVGGIFLLVLIVLSVYIIKTDGGRDFRSLSGEAFSTTWTVVYQPVEDDDGIEGLVLGCLKEVDGSLSAFNEESCLARINRGESDEPDSLLTECLGLGLRVAEATGGVFDPTVGAVVSRYGFGGNAGSETEDLSQAVGWQKLSIEDGKLVKENEEIQIDLSAIAKGFAVDRVGEALEAAGIENYLVEIGGEIRCKGSSPSAEEWTIGISRPERDARGSLLTLQTTNTSMATSGNYRNFREVDGGVIGHIMDPRTLKPGTSQTISATVVAEDCATADAWATALMVMSPDESMTAVGQEVGLEALIVYVDSVEEQHIWSTDSLHSWIVSVDL